MKAVVIGIIILAAAVFAILPQEVIGFGLGWGDNVLAFLKGGLPVIAILMVLFLFLSV